MPDPVAQDWSLEDLLAEEEKAKQPAAPAQQPAAQAPTGEVKQRCAYELVKGEHKGERCTLYAKHPNGMCNRHRDKTNTPSAPPPAQRPPRAKAAPASRAAPPVAQVAAQPAIETEEKHPPKKAAPEVAADAPGDTDAPAKGETDIIRLPVAEDDSGSESGSSTAEEGEIDPAIEAKIAQLYSSIPRLSEVLPKETRGGIGSQEWYDKLVGLALERAEDRIMLAGMGTLCGLAEAVGVQAGFEVQGFREAALRIPEIPELLTILRLRHCETLAEIPIEAKIIFSLGNAFMQLHTARVALKARTQTQRDATPWSAVPPQTVEPQTPAAPPPPPAERAAQLALLALPPRGGGR